MPELIILVASLVATLAMSWPLLLLLRRGGVIDVPNARSSHTRVTPRGGGIAVVLGVSLGLAVGSASAPVWGVVGGASVAAVVGFADDQRGQPAQWRLSLQGLVAALIALLLLRASDLGVLVWAAALLGASFWITAYVNAFNFMDGINGISGVSAALAGGWYVLLGETESVPLLSTVGAALLGAALGFLPWNVGVARMFLGDVGSYFMGTLIAALAVAGVVAGVAPLLVVAPLLLYAADTGWTLTRRLRRGDPWREAHRGHAYQRLCDVGWSQPQVTALVLIVTLTLCLVVWLLPTLAASGVCAAVLVAFLASPRWSTGWSAGAA